MKEKLRNMIEDLDNDISQRTRILEAQGSRIIVSSQTGNRKMEELERRYWSLREKSIEGDDQISILEYEQHKIHTYTAKVR